MLQDNLPQAFRNRELDDLGCGDGRITLILRDIFRPKRLRGFDINPILVKRAKRKGIEAEVRDLSAKMPAGELAVMWGVLHHLQDRETCLKRISENYAMAFIREPVKNNIRVDLEMGKPLDKEEIEIMVQKYFTHARFFYYGNSIFIFHMSPILQAPTDKG